MSYPVKRRLLFSRKAETEVIHTAYSQENASNIIAILFINADIKPYPIRDNAIIQITFME